MAHDMEKLMDKIQGETGIEGTMTKCKRRGNGAAARKHGVKIKMRVRPVSSLSPPPAAALTQCDRRDEKPQVSCSGDTFDLKLQFFHQGDSLKRD